MRYRFRKEFLRLHHACLFDLVYNPLETRLTKDARVTEVRAISGLEMFIEQGAGAGEIVLGRDADGGIVEKVLNFCCSQTRTTPDPLLRGEGIYHFTEDVSLYCICMNMTLVKNCQAEELIQAFPLSGERA